MFLPRISSVSVVPTTDNNNDRKSFLKSKTFHGSLLNSNNNNNNNDDSMNLSRKMSIRNTMLMRDGWLPFEATSGVSYRILHEDDQLFGLAEQPKRASRSEKHHTSADDLLGNSSGSPPSSSNKNTKSGEFCSTCVACFKRSFKKVFFYLDKVRDMIFDDDASGNDPYVKVTFKNNEQNRKTKPVVSGGQHVEWTSEHEHRLVFPVTAELSAKFPKDTFFFELAVFDAEVANRDRLIGSRTLACKTLVENPGVKYLFKVILRSESGQYGGRIEVCGEFIPSVKEDPITDDDQNNKSNRNGPFGMVQGANTFAKRLSLVLLMKSSDFRLKSNPTEDVPEGDEEDDSDDYDNEEEEEDDEGQRDHTSVESGDSGDQDEDEEGRGDNDNELLTEKKKKKQIKQKETKNNKEEQTDGKKDSKVLEPSYFSDLHTQGEFVFTALKGDYLMDIDSQSNGLDFVFVVRLTLFALCVLAFTSSCFIFIEGWTFYQGLYFCMLTVATVGYGDFVPKTQIGKVYVCCIIAFLVGLIFVSFTFVMQFLVQEREKSRLTKTTVEIQNASLQRQMEGRQSISASSSSSSGDNANNHKTHGLKQGTIRSESKESISGETGIQNHNNNNNPHDSCIVFETEASTEVASERTQGDEEGRASEEEENSEEEEEGGGGPRVLSAQEMILHAHRNQLLGDTVALLLWVLGWSSFYVLIPGEQLSVIDAIYFAFVTASTVGFGDVHPQTDMGRVFCAIFMLVGVSFLARVANTVASYLMNVKRLSHEDEMMDRLLLTTEQFSDLDESGDGLIDKFEYLQHVLVQTGKVEKSVITKITDKFDEIDTDNDGYISLEDMNKALKQISGSGTKGGKS